MTKLGAKFAIKFLAKLHLINGAKFEYYILGEIIMLFVLLTFEYIFAIIAAFV